MAMPLPPTVSIGAPEWVSVMFWTVSVNAPNVSSTTLCSQVIVRVKP